MPKRTDLHKILVIGSGPIVIGQAAEFDYAGTQACRALKEDGLEVVLVNSNPATIMTDGAMADRIYIEPLSLPVLRRIIEKEMAQHSARGTKAQQALAEQREALAQERKSNSKQRKEELKDARFQQKQAKRKEKHRGH